MRWQNDIAHINEDTPVFWFRRDLRINDNAGLYHALKAHANVVPIFIFDTRILEKLDDVRDARVSFIHESLTLLQQEIRGYNSSLLILYGDPVALFRQMKARVVYANADYEPYARERDSSVDKILQSRGRYTFNLQGPGHI